MTSLMVMYRAWSDRGVLILYVAPWSSSGRSSFSCICSIAGTFSSGCLMENPVIFLSMTFAFTRFLLKLVVVAFFHGFIEIGCCMGFTVILHLLMPFVHLLSSNFQFKLHTHSSQILL